MFDFFKGTVTPQDWTFAGVVVGLALAIAALFYAVVHPRQGRELEAAKSNVAAMEARLKQAEYRRDNVEELDNETAKMDRLVAGFKNRLPGERDIQRLISQFEEQGAQLGLLVSLEPQEKLTDDKKETYPYLVQASGDYHDIVTFINLFEIDERYIKVSDLQVKEQKLVDGRPTTEASFTLSTFVFQQEDATATGGVS